MSVAKIRAEKRPKGGSAESRRLRSAGNVPGIIYGHGQDPVLLWIGARELLALLKSRAQLCTVDLSGASEQAIIKDVQYDTFGQHLLHVDLLRVDITEAIQVKIPVEVTGHPKGMAEGGILEQFVTEIPIRCTPDKIPEFVSIKVDDLGLHQSVRLKDVPLPEGVSIAADPELVICSCVERFVAAVPAPAAEGAAAEPAVVDSKGKEPAAADAAKKEEAGKAKAEAKPKPEKK